MLFLKKSLFIFSIILAVHVPRPASCAVVPLFDIRPSPPLLQISSMNSSGRLLAVQASDDGKSPGKVVAIDRRGRISVVEDLTETKELTVPAGRLWIAGEEVPEGPDAPSRKLPVLEPRVYLAESGETYTAVFRTKGAYYELRHKGADGRLLFIACPRDALGLSAVVVSRDGSRVLVSDEPPAASGMPGQRLYMYDRDGVLLMDEEMGEDPAGWLDVPGGFMEGDGGWFMAGRGGRGLPAEKVALYGGEGRLRWEKNFFNTHRLMQETGGLVAVQGGNQSFINFIDKNGSLKMLERSGYGFDFWLSDTREHAYLIVFKPFDVGKSGVPEAVGELFPGAHVVAVDMEKFLPEGQVRPGIRMAPDGKAFVFSSVEVLGGQEKTHLALYGSDLKERWRESFFTGEASAQFVYGSRGFLLKFRQPVSRLIYYEDK